MSTVAWALRRKLKQGYSKQDLLADIKAGTVVGIVAIPLGMALAVAIGVPPQHGIYTCVVGGILCSLLGGSKFQVTGPTAAFVVVLVPIVQKYGMSGLFLSGAMAGLILIALGLLRLGRIIEILPHPVTTGFTSGIALVILTLQIKDFMGLNIQAQARHFHEHIINVVENLAGFQPQELFIGLFTLTIILLLMRFVKKTPAPLVGLGATILLVELLQRLFPGFEVATIETRFSTLVGPNIVRGVPPGFPPLINLFSMSEIGGLRMETVIELLPSAFSIALLGAIESLLSATVADGMAGTRHNPNAELVAQGITNVVCPFFGGIPATGAIARTATNIRFGGRSPFASMIHGVFCLAGLLFLAPLISKIPMASLAALLMVVAYNMSEIRHYRNILKLGTRDDKIVLLICFGLTVFVDMTAGVLVGFGLATLLFMNRVANITQTTIVENGSESEYKSVKRLPENMQVYRIQGAMFFGAAYRAMSSLASISRDVKHVVLDLSLIEMVDITGLTALSSTVKDLNKRQITCTIVVPNVELSQKISQVLETSPLCHIETDEIDAVLQRT